MDEWLLRQGCQILRASRTTPPRHVGGQPSGPRRPVACARAPVSHVWESIKPPSSLLMAFSPRLPWSAFMSVKIARLNIVGFDWKYCYNNNLFKRLLFWRNRRAEDPEVVLMLVLEMFRHIFVTTLSGFLQVLSYEELDCERATLQSI